MKSLLITKNPTNFVIWQKSFNDHSSYAEEIVTANKKGITVKHRVQPMETGWINWTLLLNTVTKFVRTASSTKNGTSSLWTKQKR